MSRPMKAADLRAALEAVNAAMRAVRPVYAAYCRAEQFPRSLDTARVSGVPARIYTYFELSQWVRSEGDDIERVLDSHHPAVLALLSWGEIDNCQPAGAQSAVPASNPVRVSDRATQVAQAGGVRSPGDRLLDAIFGSGKDGQPQNWR